MNPENLASLREGAAGLFAAVDTVTAGTENTTLAERCEDMDRVVILARTLHALAYSERVGMTEPYFRWELEIARGEAA